MTLDGLIDRGVILRVTHDGSSNIVIWSYTPDGEQDDLLVNAIGAYSGTVMPDPYNLAEPLPTMLEIEADGYWTIDVAPVFEATPWDAGLPIAGIGDSVMWVPPAARPAALTKVAVTGDGDSNLVISTVSRDDIDLLVNEIAPYAGTKLMQPGTAIVIVEAEGPWSITPG